MVVFDGQMPRQSPLVGSPVRVPHCPLPKIVCFAHCGTLHALGSRPVGISTPPRDAFTHQESLGDMRIVGRRNQIRRLHRTPAAAVGDGAAAARCCCRNDRPLAGLTPPALMPGPTQPDACFHSHMFQLRPPHRSWACWPSTARRRGFGTLACTLACTLARVLNPVHWGHSRRWRTRRASWSMAAGSTPPEPSWRP